MLKDLQQTDYIFMSEDPKALSTVEISKLYDKALLSLIPILTKYQAFLNLDTFIITDV